MQDLKEATDIKSSLRIREKTRKTRERFRISRALRPSALGVAYATTWCALSKVKVQVLAIAESIHLAFSSPATQVSLFLDVSLLTRLF